MTIQQVVKKRTQKQRREEAENRLMEALIAVIDRDGLSAVTCESVSEEAQCSPGLVILRLGKRNEMFANLGIHLQQRSLEKMKEIDDANIGFHAKLAAFVNHHFDSFRDDPGYRAFSTLMVGNLKVEPELNNALRQSREYLMRWVQNALRFGVETGEFSADTDVEQTASWLGAAFLGAPQFLKLFPDRMSHLEMMRQKTLACLPQNLKIAADK